MTPTVIIAAMYHFSEVKNPEKFQKQLLDLCKKINIKGTLLVAHEGINGTVSGSRQSIDSLLDFLKSQPEFTKLEHKESTDTTDPFVRLKVKLKKEIVTLGQSQIDPTKQVGTYVDPQDWNKILEDPEIAVIDTRNQYEYEIGTFKGAINPRTETFREFPDFVKNNFDSTKHKKVAMFCTGGIRCEKASSYMLNQGFEEVLHLKGGILKYLENVDKDESLWDGECFVFDDRVSVKHGLEVGDATQCHGCRRALYPEDLLKEHYIPGVQCHKCFNTKSDKQKQRYQERQKQVTLAKKRNQKHIGQK